MPGPAAHLSIIELQTARAAADPGKYGMVAHALSNNPQFAHLGAIGPDMLFWADWGGYTSIVSTVFDVYHSLDTIYDKLDALWSPIGKAIDKTETALTGGLVDSINQTLALVKGIINSKMLELITHELNYWETLRPHFQDHSPHDSETSWNWLDYTHHRRTGKFTKEIIRRANASGDDTLRAYAYGWMSHVTADVVGHAFVNQAVGGPWRTHFQRHHLQENFMDVWTWGFYHTPGVTLPATVADGTIPFDYTKFTNLGSANMNTLIDLGDDMPDNLQSLIVDSLQTVYGSVPHPTVIGHFLGKSDINRAYQELKEAFEIMTGKKRHLDPPAPPKVFGDLAPPTFPTPGGSGGGSGGSHGGSHFSLASLLKAIWDAITDGLNYLFDLATWLVSLVTSPLTYPLRYALYLIQLGLYDIYRNFRWALVISAYVYPDADQLSRPEAQQFLCPPSDIGHLLRMPHLEFPKERDHCHEYPGSAIEQPEALAAPYNYGNRNYPYWFIEGEKTNASIETSLINAKSPEETMKITSILGHGDGSIGCAVDLFLRRAAEIQAAGGGSDKLVLPDWNLDADRGYAFHCWEAQTKIDGSAPNGIVLKYLP